MLEHLAWHTVRASAPVEDKEAASQILQGRARRSPWHAPYARRPPPPSGRPRSGPGGGGGGVRSRSGGGPRYGPPRVYPRGTAPPGPPVGPPGSRLPTPHGPGPTWRPGCPRGPRGNAGAGQLTPGRHGARRPLAPLLETAQRPRPTGPVPPGHPPATPRAGGLHR